MELLKLLAKFFRLCVTYPGNLIISVILFSVLVTTFIFFGCCIYAMCEAYFRIKLEHERKKET